MVEKEVTLKILADVDDSQVEDLQNILQQIVDGKITIPVETESSELEEVESRIEELEQKRADIYMGMDDTELEEVEAELDELEARQIELSVDADSYGVDDVKSSVEDLESEIDNVNNTPISPQGDTSGVDNVSESVSGLNEALTAVGAGVSLAGIEQMVETAGNIEDSWNRLALTFGTVTDEIKADISSAVEATGRSGALARQYFNDMGIAGIRNSKLLEQSFEALSGQAYHTNNSIESMEQKLKMMVMSGNAGARQLTQLGLTTDDLGRVMGVTGEEASNMFKNLSQEERLRVLTQAMGEGKQANEMYKNSWQGLKAQIDKATAGLMGAIGSAILPVLIPAMKTAADVVNFLADGFKKLPEPIRAVIGIVGALVMGFLAITTVVSVLKTLESTLKLVTTAQRILNIVTAMNPYVLLAMAILALIAALWYLYNTNESVRAAIDGFIQALMGVGQAIYGSLMGAFEWLQGAWQNTVDFFTNGGTAISDAITGTFIWIYESIVAIFTGIFEWLTGTWQGIVDFFTENGQLLWDTITGVFMGVYETIVGTLGGAFQWLTDTWNSVVNAFMTYAPLIAQILFIMATGGIGAIILLIAHMNGMPNQVGAILQSVISRVVSWVGNLVSQFASGAQRAVSNFLSPLKGLVDSVSAELSAVYSAVMSFIQPLIDAFNALGSAASWAFSFLGLGQRSPGDIYKSMKRELEWTTSFVEDDKPGLVSATANLGRDIVSSFNPRIGEGLSFDVNGFEANKQGTQSTGANGNGRQIVNNLTFNLYGDMDTEERMKKFLDYVTEYLDWDNNTAGRNMEVL